MFKNHKKAGQWWSMPLTPALREAEVGRISEVSLVYRAGATQGDPVSKQNRTKQKIKKKTPQKQNKTATKSSNQFNISNKIFLL